MDKICKKVSANQYPYPIKDWKNEKAYLNHFDYFADPTKYTQLFLDNNQTYQNSLNKYLNYDSPDSDTYSPFFFYEVPFSKELWVLLEGESCGIETDISAYWGWELLKRNHAYQHAYDRYINRKDFNQEGLKIIYQNVTGFIDGTCTILDEACILNKDGTTQPLIEYIAGFFGIDIFKWTLPNPRANHIFIYRYFWKLNPGVSISYFDSESECQRALNPRSDDEIVFRINASLPLQTIKNRIEFVIDSHANKLGYKNSHLPKNETYKKYIRVLDAKRSGATFEEIANVIYPHLDNTYDAGYLGTKSVRALYKEALSLTRKGYLKLFFSRENFSHPKLKKGK